MHEPFKVSIVINTYNRAPSLDVTLKSLHRLNYPHCEVIVVNGPSTDSTLSVLEANRQHIRVGTCADRNLSVSRNVGIEMACGNLVAFLDDDAVPDEDWLNDAVAAIDSEEVGGVGGFIYDHTGYNLQYRYSVSNRLGTARWDVAVAGAEFCYPGCLEFPYLQGTNAIFRRAALLEVGGFDEEFDYYLDETDVCLRLVDAGYLLKQISGAFVYHRFLPSRIRNQARVVMNWRSIIKNKAYFALKNAPPETSFRDLMKDWEHFCTEAEANLKFHVEHGNASKEVLDEFHRDVDTALREGVRVGLTHARRFLDSGAAKEFRGLVGTDVLEEAGRGVFKPYPTALPKSEKLTICLLSQEYPPAVVGGIGRFTHALAGGLAERGHSVHVLARSSSGHNTVDFEEGIWVHRLVEDREEMPVPPGVTAPAHIWRRSARLLREVRRIHETHRVDIVEAPLWDAEGLATVVDGSFCAVTSLHTPLKMALENNPEWLDGSEAQQRFFKEMAAAETLVARRAHAVRANSRAIVETMRKLYGVEFRPGQVTVVPHGLEDRMGKVAGEKDQRFLDVLFTGRFETRKGIDILLQVIPSLCSEYERARFILVGEDRPRADGTTLTGLFRTRHARAPFRDRVIFAGKVTDIELERYLAQCDIFVAPSRYESFGLVFLEAMMFSKPVVGCRVGGMPEIIQDAGNGLLAEPGDVASLHSALSAMLADEKKREAFGKAGREIFLRNFTREKLAERTLEFYREVLRTSAREQKEFALNRAG